MKSLSKLFMACGLIVGLAACNKELTPEQKLPTPAGQDDIFMSFNISMPSTRSTTDEAGQTPSNAKPEQEDGIPDENTIGTVQLVLVDPTTKLVVAVSNPDPDQMSNPIAGQYVCPFDSEDLIAAALTDAQKPLKVLAFCNKNYTAASTKEELKREVGKELDVNRIYNVAGADEDALWAKNAFIMTNAKELTFNLPTKNDLVTKYKDAGEPLRLGVVEVERLAARFDFAADNVNLKIGDSPITVEFKQLGIFNLSKQMYMLRRVSEDGLNKADNLNWTGLLGAELLNNYLVDPQAAAKNALVGKPVTADFFHHQAAPAYTAVSAIKDNGADQWKGAQEYYRWRYAAENIMPAPGEGVTNNQYENLCTGIDFVGTLKYTAAEESPAKTAMGKNETVYVFNNTMYGNKADLEAAANKEGGALLNAYNAVVALGGDFEAQASESKKFLVYKAPYDVHYTYYNRHNDNGNHAVSDNMEFAVVRNNVYKLAVTKVMKFGATEFEKPGPDPIETNNAYFEVTVKVLPWTVRENNIEF